MGIIAFNPDSIHTAVQLLKRAIENSGGGALNDMPENVKSFYVGSSHNSVGHITELSGLANKLRASLSFRSAEAQVLYKDLLNAIEALEKVITDFNAREDDHARGSIKGIEALQGLMAAQTSDKGTGRSWSKDTDA